MWCVCVCEVGLPMDGDIVLDMVDNLNEYIIIFSGINSWSRKFSIDGNNRF